MADATDNGSKLAALNSATLGAEMPQITLPDGSKVQTGTVGALLINIRAYNEAHQVGMFDLFRPEEWIAGDNEGRKAVGKMYLEFKSQQK
ncbi:hypothetical protein F5Y06DRAFT_293686 [Hypoxylon sp. FL0890]|nr:hypothetical protein F5Y06DRAFT_293686 [Hypoxylon sp. FL0890]